MILKDLFTDIAGFAEFVPGIDSNTNLTLLNSHAVTAYKRIANIVSVPVYKKIIEQGEGELYDYLRTALANLTMANDTVFDVLRKRKAEIDIYKSEQEAIRRAYYENYYNAMDSLIALLNTTKNLGWEDTRYYKMLDKLQIKTTEEFDMLYCIDLSYLFFFRCIPIQVEVMDESLSGYIERAKENPSVMSLINRALAKKVVAIALTRFDILEFPSTIRNLFDDSKASRTGRDEQQRLLVLSAQLQDQANALIKDIDLLLSDSQSTDIETETSFNQPEDKIQLMP
jgi:hypothetical protein